MSKKAGSTQRATIKDVARAAGVSVTTVSHALNGKGRTDPETRCRIIACARSLGYRANSSARSLRVGRSGVIGLLLPEFVSSPHGAELYSNWYGQLCIAMASATMRTGRALLIWPGDPDVSDILSRIDGIIAVDPAQSDARLKILDAAGLPVVTIDQDNSRSSFYHVAPDLRAGVEELLDHLHAQGARRIGVLAPDGNWNATITSIGACRAWQARRDAELCIVDVAVLDSSPGQLFDRVGNSAKALIADWRPDAIVSLLAGAASVAMEAATEMGLSVPEDIMIAEDIDVPQSALSIRSITALDLKSSDQAEAAVAMLVAVIEGIAVPAPIKISPQLRIRLSTCSEKV